MYTVYNFIVVNEGEQDEVLIYVSEEDLFMEGAAGDPRLAAKDLSPESIGLVRDVLSRIEGVTVSTVDSLP